MQTCDVNASHRRRVRMRGSYYIGVRLRQNKHYGRAAIPFKVPHQEWLKGYYVGANTCYTNQAKCPHHPTKAIFAQTAA